MDIEEFIPIKMKAEDINQLSPLVWAYIGDCVYELYIRIYLMNKSKMNVHKLHVEAIKYVKARRTSKVFKYNKRRTFRRRKRYNKKGQKYSQSSFTKKFKC